MRFAGDSIKTSTCRGCDGAREHVLAQHRGHGRHVDGHSLDGCVVGFEARQLEQVLDDARHAIGLTAHLGDRFRELAELRIDAEVLEVPRDHGEWRTQFVRSIRDEILAHLLEAHLARDVTQHQQALVLAIRDELERDVPFGRRIDAHDQRQRMLAAAQVTHEIRMAHEVVDAQAQIRAPRQIEQLSGLAIEPDDFALRIEHHDAVGHRRGRTAQFAEQPRESFLVETFATMQAHHLRNHVAPQSHGIGRIGDAAMLQPEMQRAKLPEIPGEIDREGAAHAEPHGTCQPSERRAGTERDAQAHRDVDEGRGARVHQRGRAENR